VLHIKAKHGGKGIAPFRAENQPDYEESFADRAIAASLDHAMGVPNDDYDWLVEPFK
jgi:DNA-binding XRE family transcriptional regulator